MRLMAALACLPALALAQSPNVSNAQYETRAAGGDGLRSLKEFVSSHQGPEWFGYAVKSISKNGNNCCWNDNCRGCRLEGGHQVFGTSKGVTKLEGSEWLFVLYRVSGREVGKVQITSENCPLDAGGLRFTWFTGVTDQASIPLLSELAEKPSGKHDTDAAMAAIAMHESKLADDVLVRFAGSDRPEWMREKALFWLASSRGERGFQVVRNAARNDPSDSVREKAMFHLTLVSSPGGVDELIRSAKSDSSQRVRKQALFWLGQKAEKRAAGAIRDAIRDDPNTDVKKAAVFALQQLPNGEGVPMLIELAKSNPNPEVRKQAMFWLGQSGDPRALEFFEQVLSK